MEAKSLIEREHEIDQFNFSFVLEKIRRENILSIADLPKIENELKRFFKLVLREDGPLAMIDKRVDEFWHSFLLFTPQYYKFCNETMGFFVHHQPRTSYTPVPVGAIKNFVDAYRKHYKNLDPFWLETLPPELVQSIKTNSVPESLTFDWSGWTGKNFV